jgi:hypothetical protein
MKNKERREGMEVKKQVYFDALVAAKNVIYNKLPVEYICMSIPVVRSPYFLGGWNNLLMFAARVGN